MKDTTTHRGIHRGKGERFNDPRYEAWRLAVLERDRYTCQHCGHVSSKRHRGYGLYTHHIHAYARFPAKRFDVDNGLTLCDSCHKEIHGNRVKIRPPQEHKPCACGCGALVTTPNRDGDPIRFLPHHHLSLRRGVPMSEEQKRRIATTTRGRSQSSDHRAKRALAQTGKAKPAPVRAKIAAALRGRPSDPTVNEKRSEGVRRAYAEGRHARPALTTWARDYAACVVCNSTERPHRGHGLCRRCHKKAQKLKY